MMSKLYTGIVLLLLFLPLDLFSQRQDFRTWWAVELEGEVFDLIDYSVSPELRLWDNSTRFESIQAELDASVPLTKFLRLGGIYRHQYERTRTGNDQFVNRMGIYAEFDTRIERLRLAYRGMYQREYTNYKTSELGNIPESQHRHKISLRYRRKGWDLYPNFAAEMFYTINPRWKSYQQKLRITAGLKYRLTKDINIGLAYRFQTEYFENNPLTSHIIKTSVEFQL